MDPLSAAASVVGLLSVAGNSCKSVLVFFRSFSDAPADIQSQYVSIQSLQTTFTALGTLYANLPTSEQSNHGLAAKTTVFLGKIEVIEDKIRLSNAMLSRGTIHRTWARIKWSLAADRWLEKFFDGLIIWNIVFSNEVAAVQVYVYLSESHKLN